MAIRFDISQLENSLERMMGRAEIGLRVIAEDGATRMQSYAKQHAPWHDRTGDARRRLNGSTEPLTHGYRVKIAHGVDYGIYLEMLHNKRYAILQQTVNYVGTNEIMPEFNRFMERMK